MKNLTPMRAIRRKCLDCCCYQPKEVTLCTATNCPLFPYRMGKRPKENYITNPSNNEKNAEEKGCSLDSLLDCCTTVE